MKTDTQIRILVLTDEHQIASLAKELLEIRLPAQVSTCRTPDELRLNSEGAQLAIVDTHVPPGLMEDLENVVPELKGRGLKVVLLSGIDVTRFGQVDLVLEKPLELWNSLPSAVRLLMQT